MYAKLLCGNIKKALRDYVIYFFTLVISSTLFFAFLSLTSHPLSFPVQSYTHSRWYRSHDIFFSIGS